MKRNWIILAVIVVLSGVVIYAYKEYNRKHVPMSQLSADFHLQAVQLISEFEENDSIANKKYLGKVIIVDGIVKEVDEVNRIVILGDSNSMHSVRCAVDSTSYNEVKKLNPGLLIKIKGNCTGYNDDELLGSDIILNRAVIVHIF